MCTVGPPSGEQEWVECGTSPLGMVALPQSWLAPCTQQDLFTPKPLYQLGHLPGSFQLASAHAPA